MQKKTYLLSIFLGDVESPVIQKAFHTKIATSIVALITIGLPQHF